MDDRIKEVKNTLDATDSLSLERYANLFELQFWPIKVEEWRKEQLSIISKMKKDDSVVIEVEQAQRKSIIKKPSKKDGVNELTPSQTMKLERRDHMTLLDGTLMMTIRDPVKFMEKLSMGSEPYLGQFLEYMEVSEEIVDIKILDAFKVKEARMDLQKRVKDDVEIVWGLIDKEIEKKNHFKIEQLEVERTRHYADFELANFELEEIVQKRLEQLPRIQFLHENEARFLIDTIKGVRQSYSNKIEVVFKEIDNFSQITLKEIENLLKQANNSYDIAKSNQKFILALERFNFQVSDLIERANLDFDHAKKMLEKSKQPGNHSSAWIIVKDASGYDPDTIGTELEDWRMSIADDLARAQKEITTDIKLIQNEIGYYDLDFKMIDTENGKMKNLNTLLLGEKIYSSKQQEKLGAQIQKFNEQSYENHNWPNCILWISQAIEIQMFAIEVAKYLSLNDPNLSFNYSTLYKPTLQSWNEWKSKHDSLQYSTSRVTMIGSRPTSSSYSKPLSAKTPNKSSQGIPHLSFGSELNVRKTMPVSASTGGTLSRPVSSNNKQKTTRPISANRLETKPKSLTPDSNTRKSTPSSALRGQGSSKDSLPPLPYKINIPEPKLTAVKPTSFKCLESAFKSWIDYARSDISKAYEVRDEYHFIMIIGLFCWIKRTRSS